jgi:hypothetical protein
LHGISVIISPVTAITTVIITVSAPPSVIIVSPSAIEGDRCPIPGIAPIGRITPIGIPIMMMSPPITGMGVPKGLIPITVQKDGIIVIDMNFIDAVVFPVIDNLAIAFLIDIFLYIFVLNRFVIIICVILFFIVIIAIFNRGSTNLRITPAKV